MKKQILSLALALALCLGLATPVLAGNGGTTIWTIEPVGESLAEPMPLPEHLAQQANSDSWLIYDFDRSKRLEVTTNEWGDRTYVMLEGAQFTIWQNPSWQGRVTQVDLLDSTNFEFDDPIYRTEYMDNVMEMRSMAPVTVTFDHTYTMPDGTVVDLAKPGTTSALRFEVGTADEGGGIILMENFQVIPAVAYASTQTVTIDGKATEFQMYAIKDANGNDTNYVKVRDVALALDGTAAQFNVGWNGNVNLEKGQPYTAKNGQENNTPYSGDQPFKAATSITNVNGEAADLTAFVITDSQGNGSTYYKLRDLGEALGFAVDWSAEKGVYIETLSADIQKTIENSQPIWVEQVENIDPAQMDETPVQDGTIIYDDGSDLSEIIEQWEIETANQEPKSIWNYN